MKIPEKIRIAGVDYEVKMVDYLNNGVNLAYGHIDFIKNTISLSATESMSVGQTNITLLHEILHGIFQHYGTAVVLENEETVIDVLAKGLYQVVRDNKEFMEEIQI